MSGLSHPYRFGGIEDVLARLEGAGYLADESTATVVHLADRLNKPLLVEGPAGVGKTELAKATARALGYDLIRLQCYEGVDETKTLYEWNYKKQLLRIQAGQGSAWDELSEDIFSEPFLLERPVLKAIRAAGPVVLLIDEIDKLDFEAEALLLEVLSDWQITIPEMGTLRADRIPFVVLTSNNERELSEALKRRCLYLFLDYPGAEREKQIVLQRFPELNETLADQVVRVVKSIRDLELKKSPSIAETLDWASTLLHLSITTLDDETLRKTLPVLLKYRSDLTKASDHLNLGS
ncbi:MAG TPA: MoxR family ATPase [Actinomycetota bacterium]|nr:MoxR family ATPase [Actinomycetota bacterium]